MGRLTVGRSTVAVMAGLALVTAAAFVGGRLVIADRTYDPGSPLTDQCGDVPAGAHRIQLTRPDGMTLGGALVGPPDAALGVVLRQGAGQTICDWLPWAGDVADRTHAQVLLFDRRGRGSSPGRADLTAEPRDLAAAARFLRDRGAHQVAVVGSSMGNSVTFAALRLLPSEPCVLVAISPVLVSSDAAGTVNGRADVRYPRHIWITWEQQNPAIVADAALIRSRARAQHLTPAHVHSVDTDDHSFRLVENHHDVRAFILDAIRSCSAARPRARR